MAPAFTPGEIEKMATIVNTVDDNQTATVTVDISEDILASNDAPDTERKFREVDRMLAANERCNFCEMTAMTVNAVPFSTGALGQSSN